MRVNVYLREQIDRVSFRKHAGLRTLDASVRIKTHSEDIQRPCKVYVWADMPHTSYEQIPHTPLVQMIGCIVVGGGRPQRELAASVEQTVDAVKKPVKLALRQVVLWGG